MKIFKTSAGLSAVICTFAVIACVGGQISGNTPKKQDYIRVASIINRPYLFEENESQRAPGQRPNYQGYVVDLLEKMKQMSNLNYRLVVRTDGKFGRQEKDGSWTGLVGQLVDKDVDVAIAPLTETVNRSRVIDFGTQFQTFGRVALVKKWPKAEPSFFAVTLEMRLGRLFAPLEDSVWLLSGLAWFVSSLVLYLICRINPYEWRRMAREREATLREGESFNCVNTYWFMLAAVFWQGFMRSPRSMGARIVVTFWWLYALIFVSMYIASLTNFLQSLPYSAPKDNNNYTTVKSFQDIVNDPSFKVGAMEYGSTWQFLKHSGDEVHNKLFEKIEQAQSLEPHLHTGIEKVRNSTKHKPYAFIAESSMAKYYIKQAPCDIAMIREFPVTGVYSLAFPINGKFQHLLNEMILELAERGILNALEKKWFSGECKGDAILNQNPDAKQFQYPPFQKVDLTSFSGALILLFIGLAAGSLVTLIEYFIFKFTEEDFQEGEQDKRPLTAVNHANKSSNGTEPMTDV